MVSYDVTSLFTNIHLEETRHLTIDLLFEAKPDLKFSRKDLQKPFQFATSQTSFLFNGNMYDRVDGVTMGSPLAPVLANISMGYHEEGWIKNYNYGGLFYLKGVLMIYLQFLKLKIMLLHFAIISIGNIGI